MSDIDVRDGGEAARPVRIDIISDVVCPWCYIGKRNLEAAFAQHPEVAPAIHWRPYQLDPTVPADGLDRQAYMERKFGDRVPEIHARIAEAGQAAGIDFAFDRIRRAPNTLDAHRLIRWAWSAGRQDAVVESLFHAFFVEGLDIGDRAVLGDRAASAGMDRDIVMRLLDEEVDADLVRGDVERARSLGVTGVPFFILEGRIGLSGAQPPDTMGQAIAKALEPADET